MKEPPRSPEEGDSREANARSASGLAVPSPCSEPEWKSLSSWGRQAPQAGKGAGCNTGGLGALWHMWLARQPTTAHGAALSRGSGRSSQGVRAGSRLTSLAPTTQPLPRGPWWPHAGWGPRSRAWWVCLTSCASLPEPLFPSALLASFTCCPCRQVLGGGRRGTRGRGSLVLATWKHPDGL